MGYLFALAAYTSWGLFPIYWRFLQEVPHFEIILHRAVWAMVFFWCLARLKGFYTEAVQSLKNIKILIPLTTSAIMIGINWFLYIYAVNSGHVLEASLGYFINPLVNVLLGFFVLKERLQPLKWAAVALATIGVVFLSSTTSEFPWISIALAFTFGIYGLIRKQIKIKPMAASCGESTILFLITLPAFYYITPIVTPAHEHFSYNLALLIVGGAVTALPLLWFAEAASRIPLSTLGFFQYIAPTLQFLTAVFLYKETFTQFHFISFGFIWLALTLFSISILHRRLS